MIGVLLFGALMFAFSRGARQGDNNLSEKKSVIVAQDILALAQKTERTVNRLLSRGCSESQLSFYNATHNPYNNAAAPTDFSCHVFHSHGGGLSFTPPGPLWYDNRFATHSGYGEIIFAGNAQMDNSGTQPLADLILWVPFVNPAVCQSLNKTLGLAAMPVFTQGPYAGHHFSGSFTATWDNRVTPAGLNAACVQTNSDTNVIASGPSTVASNQTATGSYHFYQILHAR